MTGIKVGEEVRVYDRSGRRMGQPDGGWPGTVVKVGRKYITIDYGPKVEPFGFDGKRANDPMGARRFKTMAQVSLDERLARATDALEGRGIELVRGHSLTLEQVEALADFARKL